MIFQLSTNTTYTWAEKGQRPIIEANLSRERLIQIGAVEPLTGEGFHLFIPFTTQQSFTVFVSEFAKVFPEGNIVLIKDGASWHRIKSPQEHIELWTLPPYSPELNPIEQLWQWMRDHCLNNRFFASLAELEEALTEFLANPPYLKQVIQSVCTMH